MLMGRGFIQSHKHDSDMVHLYKRVSPWQQVIALVSRDGKVNGSTPDEFLQTNTRGEN